MYLFEYLYNENKEKPMTRKKLITKDIKLKYAFEGLTFDHKKISLHFQNFILIKALR